jgi:ATP-dependent Lhr-like helicase
VFGYLHSNTVREVLIQAVLLAPMFATRWRWNASRSLALLRFSKGKKVPPQIQRMKAEDLLAAVFPDAIACQENLTGARAARRIPDHPLVQETLRDCLTEAMDLDGLIDVLRRIETGAIKCIAIDTPAPSPFSHEILNANPYAFLDDAPLEERRARAVELRRTLPAELAGAVGALDPAAIEEVARESWPVVRDADELHDALLTLVWVPVKQLGGWEAFLPTLQQDGRAVALEATGQGQEARGWIAKENQDSVERLLGKDNEATLDAIVQGWMESIGPTTTTELAERLHLPLDGVNASMVRLEAQGQVLRGRFRPASALNPLTSNETEWCHRRLLARIHRLTIGKLRKEVEPVTAAELMRFLLQWQHVQSGSRQHGEAGLLEVIKQLAGFEAAASAWDQQLLRSRMAKYEPELLDRLCLRGAVSWGRLSPHPRLGQSEPDRARRIVPTSVAPIGIFPREDGEWLLDALRDESGAAGPEPYAGLSTVAQDLRRALQERGACFFADLVRFTHHLPAEVEQGLWELVAAGLVTADGFDNLRALMDPHRRRAEGRERARRPRHTAGRWSLLRGERTLTVNRYSSIDGNSALSARPFGKLMAPSRVEGHSALPEKVACQLLRRYGVVFRDLLARESLVTSWRDLLVVYRRLELKGEVRGGRFVSGFVGEQFALPEAVEALRALRKTGAPTGGSEIKLSACDPLNLAGAILPGPRIPAVPTNFLILKDGQLVRTVLGRDRNDRLVSLKEQAISRSVKR